MTAAYHLWTAAKATQKADMKIELQPHTTHHQGYQDAVHVAFIVARSKSAGKLLPGTKCSLRYDYTCKSILESDGKMWHGVVDPFLESDVLPGELFHLYIRKECFHSLRHVFEFDDNDYGGSDTCHQTCEL